VKEEAKTIINDAKSQAINESEKLLRITEDKIKQQIKVTEDKINKEKKLALEEINKETKNNASLFISKITNQSPENIKNL
jgi:F0F1-type ATP synthase membrane subunit b/b'